MVKEGNREVMMVLRKEARAYEKRTIELLSNNHKYL